MFFICIFILINQQINTLTQNGSDWMNKFSLKLNNLINVPQLNYNL